MIQTQGELSIESIDEADALRFRWTGKSNARDPNSFLAPLLQEAAARAVKEDKPIVLDFTGMEYMNSSTFSPLVKMLHQAAKDGMRVRVEYDKARKWQTLSFNALNALTTSDGRISLLAK